MKFGDEQGLWWVDKARVSRTAQRSHPTFDTSRITLPSDWFTPDEFPNLYGPVAFDVETEDPDIHTIGPSWAFPGRGKVVGVSVAVEGAEWYFPTQHEGGNNLDHDMVMRWLKAQLAKPTLEPIFSNAAYDVGWLTVREGMRIAGKIHDIQTQMTLLDEHRLEYGLDRLGRDLLGRGKSESGLIRAVEQGYALADLKPRMVKSSIWRLPAQYVGPYAEEDARLTYDIWARLQGDLEKEDLLKIYALEQSMIPIAVAMRERGVRVAFDRANEIQTALKAKEEDLIKSIKDRTGITVDAWDPDAIAKALQTEGVVIGMTRQGRPSVTKDWLAALETPTARDVEALRIYNKARTTFIDGHVLGHARNGRVHCSFHPLRGQNDDGSGRGTIARWSSSDPNLQQIPKRNPEIQKLIRTLFLPEEGEQWAALDYSSQEPRLVVHFAAVANIPGGREAAERYRDNPRLDYHQMVADLCGIDRGAAKTINLGMAYGMGGYKLCRSLGLPTAFMIVRNGRWLPYDEEEVRAGDDVVEVAGTEGKELIRQYHEGAPFIRGMMQSCSKRAQMRGYIVTLLGRKSHFERYADTGKIRDEHAALNRLAQGSAADQTKEAMRIAWEEHKILPVITMHDELGVSVSSYGQARFLANIMETAVDLRVPSVVDVKLGDSWGNVKDADPTLSQGNGTLSCV